MPEYYMPDTISQAIEDGWLDDIDWAESDANLALMAEQEDEAAAEFEQQQRAFETWADNQVLDFGESADVSIDAYRAHLEKSHPDA